MSSLISAHTPSNLLRECGGALNNAHRAWQPNKSQSKKKNLHNQKLINCEQRMRKEQRQSDGKSRCRDEMIAEKEKKKMPLDHLKF